MSRSHDPAVKAAAADLERARAARIAADETVATVERRAGDAADELRRAEAAVESAAGELASVGDAEADARFQAASQARGALREKTDALAKVAASSREAAVAAAAEEAEARRRLAYAKAAARAPADRRELERFYGVIADAARAAHALISEANAVREAVNADRPKGAFSLADLESSVRDRARQPEMVLSSVEELHWAYEGTGARLSDVDAARVRNDGGGRGSLPPVAMSGMTAMPVIVVLRRFTVEHYHPEVTYRVGPRLEAMILPGLRADDPPILPPPAAADDWAQRPRPTLTRYTLVSAAEVAS